MAVTVHTDGASRGNPGPAAIAYVIELPDETVELGRTIGHTTNNQAEYGALVAALVRLQELVSVPTEINFFADSELMVKQINGEYRVKNPDIKPVFDKALSLITALRTDGSSLSFVAIRREHNKRADQLANLALDGKL